MILDKYGPRTHRSKKQAADNVTPSVLGSSWSESKDGVTVYHGPISGRGVWMLYIRSVTWFDFLSDCVCMFPFPSLSLSTRKRGQQTLCYTQTIFLRMQDNRMESWRIFGQDWTKPMAQNSDTRKKTFLHSWASGWQLPWAFFSYYWEELLTKIC